MLILLRQGRISKWFSGIGQEAISVGATMALEADEVVFPMHRNLGVFTTRKVPFDRLFAQWQGTSSGFTKGRDRSFHFGTMDYNIVGMISHLGPQLALADGVALAHKISGEAKVSVAFTGEGGTSEGDFHEALNVASVWKLPVIFVIENNGYGLSTPTSEQYNCKDLADRALGYGMKSYILDGNNILETYHAFTKIAADLRKNPEPVLVECKTFRMRGHEEASGTKYVPQELMDTWAEKDPIGNYEKYLLANKILSEAEIAKIRDNFKKEINETLKKAYDDEPVSVSEETEMYDVFAPHEHIETLPATTATTDKRYIDAISDGLRQAMEKHDNLVLMGQDIAEYGGVFKITNGFLEQFGHDRVRNTPICESAIVGIGLGLSLKGYKAMVEMQFSDFVTCGFNQIINNLAKTHYRWGEKADVVIRMPAGAGVAAGPFHSQTNEAWFTHTPGLKVVFPSNPQDAKGLLLAAFEDPNPVLFFEHKALYRKISAPVSDDYFTVEIGKAAVVRQGSKATIITYGMGVHWALETVNKMEENPEFSGQSIEIIDLRTLQPIDYETIAKSVKKTNRVVILHEDIEFGGIGGEISAHISEYLFEHLDAPVMRCASMNTPIPFNPNLEKQFLASAKLEEKLRKVLGF
jgi:2-oxoisovalerate dehydrogenase E1 component